LNATGEKSRIRIQIKILNPVVWIRGPESGAIAKPHVSGTLQNVSHKTNTKQNNEEKSSLKFLDAFSFI
jgi:hypothetical protein